MMTNMTKVFSGFLGLALFALVFLMGATNATAQSSEDAILALEVEKENINSYFVDRFPNFPNVKPANLTEQDWDQVNHLYAVNKMLDLLNDAEVKPLTDDINEASQLSYPTAATSEGLYYLDFKHPKSADNPQVLSAYLTELLDL